MNAVWQRLFFRTDDQPSIVTALVDAYTDLGFQRFDPFPGGTGTPPALKEIYRHFVSPAHDGWIVVLGASVDALPLQLPYLRGWLDATTSSWDAYDNGNPTDLTAYLRSDKTTADLASIQGRPVLTIVEPADEASSTLPPDVQKLARERGVNPNDANKMISRLTSQLFGKMDRQSGGEASAMQQQAQAALSKAMSGPPKVDWNSAPARQLVTLADALTLPATWRTPDFDPLKEAYQVARRLERNPRASLLPDEKESLAAVPDAGAYQPVYVGK